MFPTSVTQVEHEHGKRALARFRKMISSRYEPLLRAVTKNESLRVHPHASSSFTDGKDVWLNVPWELGSETLEHDKSTCGRRGASNKMMCPGCKVEDEVDGVVFHESGHMTENSFAESTGSKIWKIIEASFGSEIGLLPADRQARLRKAVLKTNSVLKAVQDVDKWLPFTHNVVEDLYVNRRLIAKRPGVELPLENHARDIFENGILDLDGQVNHWKDNDVNAQAIISFYLLGANLTDLADKLVPECAALVHDPVLVKISQEIPGDCLITKRMEASLKVLVRLRELGFCPATQESILPPDPGPGNPGPGEPQGGSGDPQDDASDDDDDASDEEPGDGQDGASDGDDDASDDPSDQPGGGQAGDDDASDEEPGDGQDDASDGDDGASSGDPSDGQAEASDGEPTKEEPAEQDEAAIEEQRRRAQQMLEYLTGHAPPDASNGSTNNEFKMERIIVQEGLDSPSDAIKEYNLVSKKEASWSRYPTTPVKVPESMLAPSLNLLRVVFAENKRTGIERSLPGGPKLDTKHLYRVSSDDNRIFARRNVPKSRDWFVLVGLDFSGSTGSNGADYATKMAGHAVGELLHRLAIPFAMYSHTSGIPRDGSYGRTLEHSEIKGPNENWRLDDVQNALFAQHGRGVNLDGHSLEQYRKVMEGVRADRKLILYFTDGEMPCQNFDEELRLLKENIEILRKQRVDLVGVGYRTDSPKAHGLDTIQYNEPEAIISIVKGLESRLRS